MSKWWFFLDGFMDMMYENFPNPMASPFTRELLRNTMNHLIEECKYQSDFIDKVEEIVPELARDEIEYYCNR